MERSLMQILISLRKQLFVQLRSIWIKKFMAIRSDKIWSSLEVIAAKDQLIGKTVTIAGFLLVYPSNDKEKEASGYDRICVLSLANNDPSFRHANQDKLIFIDHPTMFDDLLNEGAELRFGGKFLYADPAIARGTIESCNILGFPCRISPLDFIETEEGRLKFFVSYPQKNYK